MTERQATDRRAPGAPFWVTPRGARAALVALHIVAAGAILVELFWPVSSAGYHGVERVHALEFTGSYAAYGFLACVLLVLLGLVLRRLVMRDADYYRGGAS